MMRTSFGFICALLLLCTTWALLLAPRCYFYTFDGDVAPLCENAWGKMALKAKKNDTVNIKIYFNPPIQEPLLSKETHSNLRMSSLIIAAPSCLLLPALLLSVWVCLCMRHSLLNSEQYRYSEWTFKGMTQACTCGCTSLYKHRRWRGVQQIIWSCGEQGGWSGSPSIAS